MRKLKLKILSIFMVAAMLCTSPGISLLPEALGLLNAKADDTKVHCVSCDASCDPSCQKCTSADASCDVTCCATGDAKVPCECKCKDDDCATCDAGECGDDCECGEGGSDCDCACKPGCEACIAGECAKGCDCDKDVTSDCECGCLPGCEACIAGECAEGCDCDGSDECECGCLPGCEACIAGDCADVCDCDRPILPLDPALQDGAAVRMYLRLPSKAQGSGFGIHTWPQRPGGPEGLAMDGIGTLNPWNNAGLPGLNDSAYEGWAYITLKAYPSEGVLFANANNSINEQSSISDIIEHEWKYAFYDFFTNQWYSEMSAVPEPPAMLNDVYLVGREIPGKLPNWNPKTGPKMNVSNDLTTYTYTMTDVPGNTDILFKFVQDPLNSFNNGWAYAMGEGTGVIPVSPDGTNSDAFGNINYKVSGPADSKYNVTFTLDVINRVGGLGYDANRITEFSYDVTSVVVTPQKTTRNITYGNLFGVSRGNNPTTYQGPLDTAITLNNPGSRTAAGYNFVGWFNTSGVQVREIARNSDQDITLNARWSAIGYTIAYRLNGGKHNGNPVLSYTVESAAIPLRDPTRPGYTFNGWYTNSNFTASSKVTSIPSKSVGNKTFHAKWTAKQFTVTYDGNGGSVTKADRTKKVTFDNKYVLPKSSAAKRTNHLFKGWYDKKSGGTKITASTTVKITKNTTVYAQWTQIKTSSIKKPTVKSLRNPSSGRINVTINKVSPANGYQIRYATNSKFTKGITPKAITKTTTSITKLKKGTTYWVSVRAYRTDSAGNKVYGNWGAAKKLKVTK